MKKKINISIVGTGLMGVQHIKAILKSKKSTLHSIVDISKNASILSRNSFVGSIIIFASNDFSAFPFDRQIMKTDFPAWLSQLQLFS